MLIECDRRCTLLQALYGLVQPLHDDGDQGACKQDIVEQDQDGGDRALGGPLIITQIAGVGEAQEGLPDCVGGGLKPRHQQADQNPPTHRDHKDQT